MATVGELSKKYSTQLSQLQSIFPSWDDGDLLFALQDVKGSLDEAVLAISEGRASQFTQATKKKAPKSSSASKPRNDGGWESPDSFSGGRGGRAAGAARGGRGGGGAGRGAPALRGARVGRGGARGGGRGGYGNVNGANKKQNGAPSDAWPTTTSTSAEGWSNQVQQAEAASAHEDDGAWGETTDTKTTEAEGELTPVEKAPVKPAVAMGAWGKPRPPSLQPKDTAKAEPKEAPAPAPVPAAAPVAPKEAPKEEAPAPEPAASAPPAVKPKMTWAQIAKPPEKPKPVAPPPPKAPEPQPEPEVVPEPETVEEEGQEEAAPEEAPEEEEVVEEETAVEEPASEPEAVVEDVVVVVEETTVVEATPEEPTPAPAAEPQDSWASDPAIVGSAAPAPAAAAPAPAPAPAPESVTTYTGPPGFNPVPAKAVGSQGSRTNSRAAHRYKNADGQAVVLPAQASAVNQVEVQFGSLSFGGLNGDGVEAPVPETPSQPEPVAASPVRSTVAPAAAPAAQPPVAAPAAASGWPQQQQQQQQQGAQQPAGYPPSQTLQQQMQAYQSYGQQPQQVQQPSAPEPAQQPQQQQQQPAQQTQQPPQQQQQQYGYRQQQDYYNSLNAQSPGQQPESPAAQQQQPQQQQQQPPQQQQQQQPQQHSYEAQPFGGFGSHQGWPNQHAAQQSDYGHRAFDSYSSYPRPPAEDLKQAAPVPLHTSGPAQPQQNLPHQQNQYYSAISNMGYYHSGPYNPYYQYGQAPNPGFQQYYPMATRNLYGQPAPQAPQAPQAPPAPIPNKPTPPATHHTPYGQPTYPSSSGFDDQSFGLGRYGDSAKAGGAPQSGAAQGQQNPQPIGSSGSYPSQQGLHNFLGGAPGSTASAQPNRPQAGTPDDSFKAQGAAGNTGAAQGAGGMGNRGAQPQQQPQAQQTFTSYPYGGYQNHEWSPYGQQQQQQHYSGSRNGAYSWQQ